MDKSKKTGWEKQMKRWKIALIILLPLLFGLVFWFVAHRNPIGP